MIDTKPEKTPYQWMISGDLDRKIEIMKTATESINNLPETALTFSPYSLNTNNESYLDEGYQDFMDKFIKLNGFWILPKFQQGGNRRNRYVNPHHSDSHLHADAVVECECGTRIIHEHQRHVDREGFNSHTEDCRVEWEFDAKSRLWQKRRDIIEESALFITPLNTVSKRLGVAERSVVYSFCKRLNVDYKEMKEMGTIKRHLTWLYYADQGFSYKEISEAFGIARNTISGAKARVDRKGIEKPWEKKPAKIPNWIAAAGDD